MKRGMWLISAVILASLATVGDSAELTDRQLTLTDMDTLYVFVQGVTEETKKSGLTAEQIQNEVEDKLKKMGIKVVSEEEGLKIAGSPVLYVSISAYKRTRTPAYVFHVDVGILQKVSLVREPAIESMSITWNKGQLGHCPSISLAKSLRKTVGYLMDRFEEDYRAANPNLKKTEKDGV